MGQPQFVHLHLHTDFSLLDGACDIKELVEEASRRGMPAVAVTDHGNMFAAANFYHEAATRGVKPIVGCEVYVAKGSRHDRGEKTNETEPRVSPRAAHEPGMRGSNHLLLLCENTEGYRNLLKLVSAGFLEDARESAYRLRDIFGKGNFFLEVQDQGLEIEKSVNRELVRLSRETGIPLVATNDCHYLTKSDAHAQEG